MSFVFTVDSAWTQKIMDMIIQDEGGWTLTDYSNDPGGVTYGGMTFRLFNTVMRKNYGELIDVNTFKSAALADGEGRQQAIQSRIVQIYFDEFCKKITGFKENVIPSRAALSCAVNAGMDDLCKIIQRICNEHGAKIVVDGIWGPATTDALHDVAKNQWAFDGKTLFMHLWEEMYVDKSIKNWIEWEQYIKDLEAKINGIKCAPQKPKYKYYLNLRGWLNRVARYR